MKKLFAIACLFIAIASGAQSVPPNFVGNPTATAYRNLAGYGMFGMPQDTFAIPTVDRMLNWTATKNDIIYIWSITQQKWIVASGSSIPQTLTISSPLTGTSYNTTAPITIGIDTNIIHTSNFNNGLYLTTAVTSVATNNGTGITGGTITGTGTLAIDTANKIATILQVQHRIDSAVIATGSITGTTDNALKKTGSNLNTNTVFSSLAYSLTPTYDVSTGLNKTMTITGDPVISFSNAQSGNAINFQVTQDGTGNHSVTIGGNAVAVNPAAGSVTTIACIYNGTTWTCASGYSTNSGTNTGDVTLTGQSYLSIVGQLITVNAVNLSGTHVTGTLAAARFGALTGDVTNSAGSYATTIANGVVTNAKLANSTISGIALGSNLADLTVGTNLQLSSGTTYNGGTAKTVSLQNAAADGSTKGAASFTANDFDASSGNISIDYTNGQVATNSVNGFMSSTDHTTLGTRAPSVTVGTYVAREALSPSNGLEFFQTDDGRNSPAGKYYYLNGIWNFTPQAPEMFWSYFNDFSSTSHTTVLANVGNLNNEVAGTGATIGFTTGTDLFSGLFSTGTATTGTAKIDAGQTSSQNAGFRPSTSNMYYQATISAISALSDGTNTYVLDFGFCTGGTTNPQTTGYSFEYIQTTSTNWLYRNGNNALASTGVSVATSTAYNLEVFVRSDSVFYWINNSLVAQEATVGGTSRYVPYTRIVKSAGATPATFNIDWLKIWARLQTSRTINGN